jgi:hypothetical protein
MPEALGPNEQHLESLDTVAKGPSIRQDIIFEVRSLMLGFNFDQGTPRPSRLFRRALVGLGSLSLVAIGGGIAAATISSKSKSPTTATA